MGDLATILGVQLGQKLDEINAALPKVQGYLEAGHKGGQSTQGGRTQAAGYNPQDETVLPDAGGIVSKNGYGQMAEGSMRPPVSYLPPAGGDRIVEPEAPHKGRTILLQAQVPVMNEKGQMVDVVGPKGAGFLQQERPATDAVVPIPNADPRDLERSREPYLTPPDHKTKGVFLRHMKAMYEQMANQIQNTAGIPT